MQKQGLIYSEAQGDKIIYDLTEERSKSYYRHLFSGIIRKNKGTFNIVYRLSLAYGRN